MAVMECPSCNANTRVLESRAADEGRSVRRRRACVSCGERFTTFERVAVDRLWVQKRDGRRQPFNAEKLRGAVVRAAHKRPVSAADIHGVVDAVGRAATARGGVIDAAAVGEICLRRLEELDRGAYLQFAGTLPDFNPEIGGSTAGGSVRGAREHG